MTLRYIEPGHGGCQSLAFTVTIAVKGDAGFIEILRFQEDPALWLRPSVSRLFLPSTFQAGSLGVTHVPTQITYLRGKIGGRTQALEPRRPGGAQSHWAGPPGRRGWDEIPAMILGIKD